MGPCHGEGEYKRRFSGGGQTSSELRLEFEDYIYLDIYLFFSLGILFVVRIVSLSTRFHISYQHSSHHASIDLCSHHGIALPALLPGAVPPLGRNSPQGIIRPVPSRRMVRSHCLFSPSPLLPFAYKNSPLIKSIPSKS